MPPSKRRIRPRSSPPPRPVTLAFKVNDQIGLPEAEDDQRQFSDCFHDTGAIAILSDTKDPRCIVVGRTGAGKSALLRQLPGNVINIDPADLALEFLSNSNVLQFFEALGVNTDAFYKVLWKHCLCVELLRKRFGSEQIHSMVPPIW